MFLYCRNLHCVVFVWMVLKVVSWFVVLKALPMYKFVLILHVFFCLCKLHNNIFLTMSIVCRNNSEEISYMYQSFHARIRLLLTGCLQRFSIISILWYIRKFKRNDYRFDNFFETFVILNRPCQNIPKYHLTDFYHFSEIVYWKLVTLK